MIDNGKPLTQSGVSERLWAIAGDDMDEFERRVKDYFALGYPGFTVEKYDFERRIIWLRDDR